jgi:hypothetical protein
MATKRKSKAGLKIRVIDLKKIKSKAKLQSVLKQAGRSRVAFVVANAPFKLSSKAAVS